MSLPWYYLERPTRMALLRVYYIGCTLVYPGYVAINWERYVPDRAAVLAGERSKLEGEVLNPRGKKSEEGR